MRQISKTQIIDMPTKVSDFTNDAGYLTQHQDISDKLEFEPSSDPASLFEEDSSE